MVGTADCNGAEASVEVAIDRYGAPGSCNSQATALIQ